MIFSEISKDEKLKMICRLKNWSKNYIMLTSVVSYPYSRITTAKYFCIKIDLIKYFLRVEYCTNGLSRAATEFVYKNSTIQMP